MTRAGRPRTGRWGVGMNAEGMERAGVVAATAHCELAGLQRVDKRLRRLPCVPDGRRPRVIKRARTHQRHQHIASSATRTNDVPQTTKLVDDNAGGTREDSRGGVCAGTTVMFQHARSLNRRWCVVACKRGAQ